MSSHIVGVDRPGRALIEASRRIRAWDDHDEIMRQATHTVWHVEHDGEMWTVRCTCQAAFVAVGWPAVRTLHECHVYGITPDPAYRCCVCRLPIDPAAVGTARPDVYRRRAQVHMGCGTDLAADLVEDHEGASA